MVITAPHALENETLSADEALDIVLNSMSVMAIETVHLTDSLGRALAEDIYSGVNLPPFANSAMDGYAVCFQDTAGACADSPCILSVIESEPAGVVISRKVEHGNAVRIMTGAMMPDGADSVVPVEDTGQRDNYVVVFNEIKCGTNVREAGEDVRQGDLILHKGTRISPAQMGMLAALGVVDVPVYRKPRVAILTTGSELVGPEMEPAPGRIRDSNSYSLLGQVIQAGAEVVMMERISDERGQLADIIAKAAEVSDVVITSGGVSVGDFDLVKETLSRLGDIRFWKAAIKPGKPVAFGFISDRPLFGLPGNPVSSMVTFDILVRPALLKMAGVRQNERAIVSGIIRQSIRHKEGRREFIRAVTTWSGTSYNAVPTGDQGSARLSSMLGANSYVVIPEQVGNVSEGSAVDIILFD